MQISPPFGYQAIAPFLRTQRVKLPPAGTLPGFTRRLNAMPVSFSEFSAACRDYPLVFSSNDEGKTFAPVAVLGLTDRENLFARDDGWAPGAYVPAYVRRYPFCMTRVTVSGVEQNERLICVEEACIAEGNEGEAMFGDGTEPLPRWSTIEKLLQEYEADLERVREMCGIVADYGLLEPFAMQANLNGGASMQLNGMYRVAESKLEFLNAGQHKNLLRKGIMGRIYLHLLSLENFARLLDRKAALVAQTQPASKN
ncbi:MAG: sapC family protein [Betaproteobacteria bacterium]|nr:sapC family protein [Betaproteobacteria bacterium]